MGKKEPCRVCGKPTSGVHYGVWACRACEVKMFYKRALEKNLSYSCYFGGKCSTEAIIKVRCKACRFQKCTAVGMKKQGVELPDEIRALRDKIYKYLDKDAEIPSSSENDESNLSNISPVPEAQEFVFSQVGLSGTESDQSVWPPTDPVGSMTVDTAVSSQEKAFDTCNAVALSDSTDVSRCSSRCTEDRHVPGLVDPSGSLEMWVNPRRLSPASGMDFADFLPLHTGCQANLDPHRLQMLSTVQTVNRAIDMIFGDSLVSWSLFRDKALNYGQIPDQLPTTSLDEMLSAINDHNSDLVIRRMKFGYMLPETHLLDPQSRRNIMAPWKWPVSWMIHHAPFLTNGETFVTVGQKKYHYSRFWQELLMEPTTTSKIYHFCAKFREIGLTQIERYLLMSVIWFEPNDSVSTEEITLLKAIHRHYTDVLLEVIKHRCADTEQLLTICEKMKEFFDLFKHIRMSHLKNAPSLWPNWMADALQTITELNVPIEN